MLVEVPGRMMVPLAVLGVAGTLRSRLHLRLLTFLAQREFPGALRALRGGGYAFEAGLYGPRCGLLDRDMHGSPRLVEHGITRPAPGMARFGHLYRITGEGARSLDALRAGADRGAMVAMERRIRGLLSGAPAAPLEAAYGGILPEEGAADLEAAVAADLARVGPPIRRAYEETANDDAVAAAEVLKAVGTALSASAAAPGIQRRVILRLSGEIAGECDGLVGRMGEHEDPALEPRVADIDDLARSLATYCEDKGIMKDPMACHPDEVVSAEDARSLWAEMRKAYPVQS